MPDVIKNVFEGFIHVKEDMLFTVLTLLTIVMIIDYITGMLAAKKEGIEHPKDERYGWSSKKSIQGIYKKVGYVVIVLVAVITDYLIYIITEEIFSVTHSQTIFGVLVSVWLILNELISILENSGRMGAQLPEFLKKILSELKKNVEDSGNH